MYSLLLRWVTLRNKKPSYAGCQSSAHRISLQFQESWASLVAQMVKKLKADSSLPKEAGVHSLGPEPGEKAMATRSGIPAWRISWAEEPGGL